MTAQEYLEIEYKKTREEIRVRQNMLELCLESPLTPAKVKLVNFYLLSLDDIWHKMEETEKNIDILVDRHIIIPNTKKTR